MTRLFTHALLSLLLLPAWAQAESAKPRAQAAPAILIPGEFHGDDVPRKLGSGWLALQQRSGVWRLVPTRVSARRVHDALLDGPGQATGREVIAKPAGELLLRHPSLKPGVVRQAPVLKDGVPVADAVGLIEAKQAVEMRFAGKAYSLAPHGPARAVVEYSSLNLRTPQHSVVVVKPFVLKDGSRLQWAGDLDRDGHPDLVVSDSDNGSELCLFLSGGSAKRLTRVGCFTSTGC